MSTLKHTLPTTATIKQKGEEIVEERTTRKKEEKGVEVVEVEESNFIKQSKIKLGGMGEWEKERKKGSSCQTGRGGGGRERHPARPMWEMVEKGLVGCRRGQCERMGRWQDWESLERRRRRRRRMMGVEEEEEEDGKGVKLMHGVGFKMG